MSVMIGGYEPPLEWREGLPPLPEVEALTAELAAAPEGAHAAD